MSRNAGGIYTLPGGFNSVKGVPLQPVESSPYNNVILDFEQDANVPRPIVAGGTAATTSDAALVNLKGERATQVITDFNTHTYLPGSFTSATNAIGQPIANHAYGGIVYMTDSNWITVEARSRSDATSPGKLYTRQKKGGVWGDWVSQLDTGLDNKVDVSGDTMTGDLKIGKTIPALILEKPFGSDIRIWGRTEGSNRWIIQPGDSTPESAGDLGSNFRIQRYSDDGAVIGTPLLIDRASGLTTFSSTYSPVSTVATLHMGGPGVVDTSIVRVSPGVISVEGAVVATNGSTPSFAGLTTTDQLHANSAIGKSLTVRSWSELSSTGGGAAAWGSNAYYDPVNARFEFANTHATLGWALVTVQAGLFNFYGGTGATTEGNPITLGTPKFSVSNAGAADFGDPAGTRTNLGLGTAALQNTGTSGATVPLCSTANTWTTTQAVCADAPAVSPFVQLFNSGQIRLRNDTATVPINLIQYNVGITAVGHGCEQTIYFGRGGSGELQAVRLIAQATGDWATGAAKSAKYSILCRTTDASVAQEAAFGLGLVVGGPSGGAKGIGTVNATGVYDDNVLLTCYVLDAARNGDIDLGRFDGFVAHKMPEHKNARAFAEHRMEQLDARKYAAIWKQRGYLPGFWAPPDVETLPGPIGDVGAGLEPPVGKCINGLIETCELLAVHVDQLASEIDALTMRLDQMEASARKR